MAFNRESGRIANVSKAPAERWFATPRAHINNETKDIPVHHQIFVCLSNGGQVWVEYHIDGETIQCVLNSGIALVPQGMYCFGLTLHPGTTYNLYYDGIVGPNDVTVVLTENHEIDG